MKYDIMHRRRIFLLWRDKMEHVIDAINRCLQERMAKGHKVGMIGTEESVADTKQGV